MNYHTLLSEFTLGAAAGWGLGYFRDLVPVWLRTGISLLLIAIGGVFMVLS